MELTEIRKKLKKELDKDRYEHTKGVMYTAGCLAMAYEYPIEKAMLAGLLHDCAKCFPNEELIAIIKEHLEVDVDFKSDELDYVEFTQTQPLGFDFDEVTHFISLTKYTMHNLEKALKQRERDIVKVASQVKRVEQKMIEANQAKEMERMIGGMTEEERLIEENMELKVTINELNRKLANGADNENIIKDLKSQVEVLMHRG